MNNFWHMDSRQGENAFRTARKAFAGLRKVYLADDHTLEIKFTFDGNGREGVWLMYVQGHAGGSTFCLNKGKRSWRHI